jgi:hypothetical protein
MSKPIKSYDSRKPAIVAALKRVSGCRKVTSVKEIAPGLFAGTCMWPAAATEYTVTAEFIGATTPVGE